MQLYFMHTAVKNGPLIELSQMPSYRTVLPIFARFFFLTLERVPCKYSCNVLQYPWQGRRIYHSIWVCLKYRAKGATEGRAALSREGGTSLLPQKARMCALDMTFLLQALHTRVLAPAILYLHSASLSSFCSFFTASTFLPRELNLVIYPLCVRERSALHLSTFATHTMVSDSSLIPCDAGS